MDTNMVGVKDSKDLYSVWFKESLRTIFVEPIFSSAIKKLVDTGYNEEMAEMAISRKSIYKEGDTLTNIVNDTVKNLEGEGSENTVDIVFHNLQQLSVYTSDEMLSKHMDLVFNIYSDYLKPRSNKCVPHDPKIEHISKLLSRAEELHVEMRSWIHWESVKLMQIAEKIHMFQDASRDFKTDMEQIKAEKKLVVDCLLKTMFNEVHYPMKILERQLVMAASSKSLLEVKKSLLETAFEAVKLMKNHQKASLKEQEEVVQSLEADNDFNQLKDELKDKNQKLSSLKQLIQQEKELLVSKEERFARAKAKTEEEPIKGKARKKCRTVMRDLKKEIAEVKQAIKVKRDQSEEDEQEVTTLQSKLSPTEKKLEAAKSLAVKFSQQVLDSKQQIQSLEKEKDLLLDELNKENQKVYDLQKKIENLKNHQTSHERGINLVRADSAKNLEESADIVKSRKEHEAIMKAEEDVIKEKAASERQIYEESIANIEKAIMGSLE